MSVFIGFFGISAGFLFDTKCVASSPCTCSREFIYCNKKNLTQFPLLTEHPDGLNHHEFYLRLDNNNLTTIPALAFENLSSIDASRVYLHFEKNHINNIDINAFEFIENNVTYLNLEHNFLTHLPAALGKLTSLNYLLLLDNPLVSLDAIIFASMSTNLRTLSLSLRHFASLPHELHVLSALQSLTLHNITFPDWNSTVFQIFETSLKILHISYSNFTSIPSAVCGLHALTSLNVNHSPNLNTNNVPIFDKCAKKLAFLTYLSLQYNDLTVLPRFGSLFPTLETLRLDHNLLSFVQDDLTFANLWWLNSLYLRHNQLSRIPFAVNRAQNLRQLFLSSNQIKTVEGYDVFRLRNLTWLTLDNNPVDFISDNVFNFNPFINNMDLSKTMLKQVPRALMRLPRLQIVYESGLPIECSCQAMSYLKRWNVKPIQINAKCSSGGTVKTFLTHNLTTCS